MNLTDGVCALLFFLNAVHIPSGVRIYAIHLIVVRGNIMGRSCSRPHALRHSELMRYDIERRARPLFLPMKITDTVLMRLFIKMTYRGSSLPFRPSRGPDIIQHNTRIILIHTTERYSESMLLYAGNKRNREQYGNVFNAYNWERKGSLRWIDNGRTYVERRGKFSPSDAC